MSEYNADYKSSLADYKSSLAEYKSSQIENEVIEESALKKIARNFPEKPGVYIFEKSSKAVYIGKAKNLKKRILSYFRKNVNWIERNKISGILSAADNLRYILVNSEKEALFLEANLVFENKPQFNTMLKDTHYYPYIMLTREKFPRLKVVRERNNIDKFYGPYTSAGLVRKILEIIYKSYGIRPCDYDLKKINKACLEHYLGRCAAPCSMITEEEYIEKVERVENFLTGDIESLSNIIKEKMKHFSQNLMFEKAAQMRDVLKQINELFSPQYVVLPNNINQDFFIVDTIDFKAICMKMKNGILFSMLIIEIDNNISFEEFFAQFYYGKTDERPHSIILNADKKSCNKIRKLFELEYVGKPRNQDEEKILQIANDNLQKEILSNKLSKESLKQLQINLGLKKFPKTIEGIDIAHTQGLYTVASVITFVNGVPEKNLYRKYKITQLEQPDDFESMRIVIRRRFSKYTLPDLLLIDGGLGQVNAVKGVLEEELGIKEYQMIGLAKEEETIVFSDHKGELKLPHDSPSLRLLVAVRDEAHRFANTYHKSLRDTRMTRSDLEKIPGIGTIRKRKLLQHFGSLAKIKAASIQELQSVVKNREIALEIKRFFEQE